jgi:hypothetical protein
VFPSQVQPLFVMPCVAKPSLGNVVFGFSVTVLSSLMGSRPKAVVSEATVWINLIVQRRKTRLVILSRDVNIPKWVTLSRDVNIPKWVILSRDVYIPIKNKPLGDVYIPRWGQDTKWYTLRPYFG